MQYSTDIFAFERTVCNGVECGYYFHNDFSRTRGGSKSLLKLPLVRDQSMHVLSKKKNAFDRNIEKRHFSVRFCELQSSKNVKFQALLNLFIYCGIFRSTSMETISRKKDTSTPNHCRF